MTLFDWVLGRDSGMYVPNWTPERSVKAERWTYRYLGIRPEPIYVWSRKYRPKAKLQNATVTKFERSA